VPPFQRLVFTYVDNAWGCDLMKDWTEDWDGFVMEEYEYTDFPPGDKVLDLGCGR